MAARPARFVTALCAVLLPAAVAPALAQSYERNLTQVPTGGPANSSYTENVDFADVDGDGDLDAVFADGGNFGNDRNRIWINQGGLQAGTVGVFSDETGARLPPGADNSRDVDFVDIDADGDMDLYVSNSSATVNQTNRWWINSGGAQLGTAGFFVDETAARWLNLGVNDGSTTFSSIAPSALIGTGGFIDWSCDCSFADLDSDGDMDLVHTSYGGVFGGGVPTRLFLNSGAGAFEEHNPSGVQLGGTTIPNGTAALWAEGVHTHGSTNATGASADIADTPLAVELGDLDGDLDLDFVHGARTETPRVFMNRLEETGSFSRFRDVTFAVLAQTSVGSTNYEQELADFDSDDDLDIYGLSWGVPLSAFRDVLSRNDGAGNFGAFTAVPGPADDDSEPDFFDYDGDGDLDILVANWVGQDRLFENGGPPTATFTNVTATEMPVYSHAGQGGDCADVDLDGDYDVFVANDQFNPNTFLKNVGANHADVTAPRLAHLEQAPDRDASPEPTPIRVHLYDNSSWAMAQFDVTVLEYSVDAGPFTPVPMAYAGGQLFRGELPGTLVGTIDYRVRSTDEHGNVGLSATLTFDACGSAATPYCTAGTTANGCVASIGASGTASAAASSGFDVTATGVDGQRQGILFYGLSGPLASSWGAGSSFLCVKAPTQRTGAQSSGGTAGACDGALTLDWNAWIATHPTALGAPFTGGETVWIQGWFRDPASPKTTSLTDALQFTVCP